MIQNIDLCGTTCNASGFSISTQKSSRCMLMLCTLTWQTSTQSYNDPAAFLEMPVMHPPETLWGSLTTHTHTSRGLSARPAILDSNSTVHCTQPKQQQKAGTRSSKKLCQFYTHAISICLPCILQPLTFLSVGTSAQVFTSDAACSL